MARALSRDGTLGGDAFAQRVADYVRRNIDVEFRFGLGKGARGAAIDQSGTPFDQAQLMVEILRERGTAASYQLGTITLTAEQFGKWTGLVTNLNESAQSFTVVARSACELLANGGIPAIVNGASDCASLSGNLTSVTLGHVWVLVDSKLYDPSFKTHILRAGMDIAATVGCGSSAAPTCGANLEAQALSGAARGTAYGAPYIERINQAAVTAYLNARAVALESAITAVDPTGPINQVTGGAEIDISQITPSALPYPTAVQLSWSGDIPDQYRVKFRVRFMGLDVALYADEVAGKRLKLATFGAVNTWSRKSRLYVDGVSIQSATGTGGANFIDRVTINTDHPLASGSPAGTYADRMIDAKIGQDPRGTDYCYHGGVTVCPWEYFFFARLVLDVGSAGAGREMLASKFNADDREDGIEVSFARRGLAVTNDSVVLASGYEPNRQSHAVVAKYLFQASQAIDVIGNLSQSKITSFERVGALFDQQAYNDDTILYFNLASSYGTASKTGATSNADAAYRSTAVVMAALEGSVTQQSADAWEATSSTSLFKVANDKAFRFYDTTPSTLANVLSNTTNYDSARKSILTSYASQGFNIILPSNGWIGNVTVANLTLVPELIYSPNQFGYMVNEEWKGGGAPGNSDPIKAFNDSLSPNKLSKKSDLYALNLARGTFTFKPAEDISVGYGDSKLSFSRTLQTGPEDAIVCGNSTYQEVAFPTNCAFTVNSAHDNAPVGWSHNQDTVSNWTGCGSEGLGLTSGLRAAPAIASLFSLIDVNRGSTFERRMTSIFATYALTEGFVRNCVTIKTGGSSYLFVKLPSGLFDPPPQERAARLILNGTVSNTGILNGSLYRFYDNTSLTFTAADGSIALYQPSEGVTQYSNYFSFNQSVYSRKHLTLPIGAQITTTFVDAHTEGGKSIKYLQAVSNSFGHKLNFLGGEDFFDGIGAWWPGDVNFLKEVSDPSGRKVKTKLWGTCHEGGYRSKFNYYNEANGVPLTVVYEYVSSTITICPAGFSDVNGLAYKMDYGSGDGSTANTIYRDRLPIAWYSPSDSTKPFLKIGYDPSLHVSRFEDALGNQSKVFAAFVGGDRYKVGELQTANGATTSSIFNDRELLLSSTDELGRVTRNVYDTAARLLRTVSPEGDAVEYQYDLRGNRTRECRIAKGRVVWASLTPLTEQTPQCNPSLGDLASTTAYVEGPTLRADQCVNMKTCNKPLYAVDAKGNRTDYVWDGTHGQLLSETKPADASGVRPVTSYGYSAFTGVDGATFYLLTSKVEKIDASRTTTTSYEYNSANKFVLKSSVVDSGGLALRTCYMFDAVGNLLSKTEPQAGLASCP